MTQQIWDLWVPEVAAQGLSFARGRLAAADVVLVHAAGARLSIEGRDDEGRLLSSSIRGTTTGPARRCRAGWARHTMERPGTRGAGCTRNR
jgi:hypothetical protein